MNVADTLRGLARRWYIVLAGAVLAVVAAVGAWSLVPPDYERTATQLLLPGLGTLPEEATNPYLYLGGLPAAADVVVRATGSEESLRDILRDYPGSEIEVTRDPTTSGPVIQIRVTAVADADAEAILNEVVARTATTLDALQGEESISSEDRITVVPISVDQESTLQQRDRIVLTGGIAMGIIVLTLIVASLVDGLVTRRRRSPRPDADDASRGTRVGDDLASSDAADEPPADEPPVAGRMPEVVVDR